jgi:hypothetical protein
LDVVVACGGAEFDDLFPYCAFGSCDGDLHLDVLPVREEIGVGFGQSDLG